MCRSLNFPYGLHESIANDDWNISARIAFRLFRQLLQVLFGQHVCGVSQMNLEHYQSSVLFGQRYINSLLESSSNGGIEDPGNVRSSQDKNSIAVLADALHLNKKFCFNSSSALALIFGTRWAERVDFIDENDARLVGSGEFKEISNQLFRFTEPFRYQVRAWDWEKCWVVCFSCDGFCEIRFTGSGWLKGKIWGNFLKYLKLNSLRRAKFPSMELACRWISAGIWWEEWRPPLVLPLHLPIQPRPTTLRAASQQ